LLKLDHLSEQHPNRLLGHSAVVLELRGAIAGEILEHGAQIGEIEQQQALVIAILEHEREHARLRVVQAEHLREEQRTEG
jgi:hypothetical protein